MTHVVVVSLYYRYEDVEGCGIQCKNPLFTNVVVSLCCRYEDVEGCGIQCKNSLFTNVVVSLCYRYEDVEGCGIQCENPLFTDDEHETVHTAIAVSASICAVCTLFTVVSCTLMSIRSIKLSINV